MKRLIVGLAFIIIAGLQVVPALAATPIDCSNPTTSKAQIQCGACDAAGSTASCDPSSAPTTLSDTIKTGIEILSVIAGAVAVVMVVIGGFRFVTSSGNPETTKSARNTILYALIGLVVIAMAQIIVHFTLNGVANTCVNNKTPSGQKC